MSDLFGKPMILLPYGGPPGCWDRIQAFVLRWAGRLAWVGVGFLIGIGVSSCT